MDIERVIETHTDEILSIPGVVGIGEGEEGGSPVVLVMVSEVTKELKDRLPERLDGFPVEIDVTGEINAF